MTFRFLVRPSGQLLCKSDPIGLPNMVFCCPPETRMSDHRTFGRRRQQIFDKCSSQVRTLGGLHLSVNTNVCIFNFALCKRLECDFGEECYLQPPTDLAGPPGIQTCCSMSYTHGWLQSDGATTSGSVKLSKAAEGKSCDVGALLCRLTPAGEA